MEGMTAARDNSLIMLEDDLNYVTGDLSKVRIMAGSRPSTRRRTARP